MIVSTFDLNSVICDWNKEHPKEIIDLSKIDQETNFFGSKFYFSYIKDERSIEGRWKIVKLNCIERLFRQFSLFGWRTQYFKNTILNEAQISEIARSFTNETQEKAPHLTERIKKIGKQIEVSKIEENLKRVFAQGELKILTSLRETLQKNGNLDPKELQQIERLKTIGEQQCCEFFQAFIDKITEPPQHLGSSDKWASNTLNYYKSNSESHREQLAFLIDIFTKKHSDFLDTIDTSSVYKKFHFFEWVEKELSYSSPQVNLAEAAKQNCKLICDLLIEKGAKAKDSDSDLQDFRNWEKALQDLKNK